MKRSSFSSPISALRRAFHVPSRQEMENAYLNGCTSLADLEMREREIARGKFSGF